LRHEEVRLAGGRQRWHTGQQRRRKKAAKKEDLWAKFAKDQLSDPKAYRNVGRNTVSLVGPSPASIAARTRLEGSFYVVVRLDSGKLLLGPVQPFAETGKGRHWTVKLPALQCIGNIDSVLNATTLDIQFGPPTPPPTKRAK
jgi:hypothetical protein